MKTEYEVKILNISFELILDKLKELDALHIGNFLQKRYTYDFVPPRQKGNFVRLRCSKNLFTQQEESTLTIKKILDEKSVGGTAELEIFVSNFEETDLIIKEFKCIQRSYEENYRFKYVLNGVEIVLDKWPLIPPLLEIEGESEDEVIKTVSLLGMAANCIVTKGIMSIYKEVYGIDLINHPFLIISQDDRDLINRVLIGDSK